MRILLANYFFLKQNKTITQNAFDSNRELETPSITKQKKESIYPCIIDYLHTIPDQVLGKTTVQILANKFNISSCYLCKVFKKKMACSPGEFLNRVKMFRAFILVESSANNDLTIYDVAEIFDFRSYNYFIRAFKKFWGTTPGKVKVSAKSISHREINRSKPCDQ